jgi:hypothetical protein
LVIFVCESTVTLRFVVEPCGPGCRAAITTVEPDTDETDDLTQIKSGLKAGQQVVLADLGQPLPSSTTSNTGTFRPGQFGGGGGFGGAGGARGTGGQPLAPGMGSLTPRSARESQR